MAAHDRAALRIDHRTVQRMERRADELFDGAGIDLGVAVHGQDKARLFDRGRVAFDAQLALLPPEQARERAERAALALTAAPALAVKAARAGEKAKAAAVSFVQGPDLFFRRGKRLRIRFVLLLRGGRQIREQAEDERVPNARSPAGGVQPLEAARGLGCAFFSREQRGDHADGPALRRDPAAQVHARQPPRPDEAREQKIDQTRRRLRDRQEQQPRRPKAPAEADEQRERRRERKADGQIELAAGRPLGIKEDKADMFPLAAGALEQLPRQRRRILPRLFGHLFEPAEIVPFRQRVHARILPRRVEREDQPRHVHALAERVEIHLRQLPQRSEERGEDGRAALLVPFRALHRTADLRERGDHGAARKSAQHFQLALSQGADALEAVEEALQPLLRQLSPARAQQRAAEREAEALPARGAQRIAAAELGARALRLAQGEICVVEDPFLRAGERLSALLLRAQRAVETPQRPQLRAQAKPLAARGACSVDGKKPRR